MSNIQEFQGNFAALTKAIIDHKGLVVTDFHASWCPSCRRLGQLLPAVAKENPEVLFLKIDVDSNEEIKNQYSITSIPALKFFKAATDDSGKEYFQELDSMVGANVAALKEKIANHK